MGNLNQSSRCTCRDMNPAPDGGTSETFALGQTFSVKCLLCVVPRDTGTVSDTRPSQMKSG